MSDRFTRIAKGGHEYPQPLVLLWFSAQWCGPCQQMKPVIEHLQSQLADKVQVLKVDVDEYQVAAFEYGIRAVPTLVLLDRKGVVDRQLGAHTSHQLIQWITSHIDVETA